MISFCKQITIVIECTVFPHIVSALEQFPQQQISLLRKNLKYCGNYLNLLQFPNLKKRIVSAETIWGNIVLGIKKDDNLYESHLGQSYVL